MKNSPDPPISNYYAEVPATMQMNNQVASGSEDDIGILILDETGLITNMNPSALKVLECDAEEAKLQLVSVFIPELADKPLMINDRLNTHLRFLSRVGHVFEVVTQQGKSWPILLFFHEMEISNNKRICLLLAPAISERLSH
ncbi:MAG: PAS domain-containing protein [Nitrosomonadales bacterium]|nr:PAS domain-containing protein [Nitrosomonadales bacterium]